MTWHCVRKIFPTNFFASILGPVYEIFFRTKFFTVTVYPRNRNFPHMHICCILYSHIDICILDRRKTCKITFQRSGVFGMLGIPPKHSMELINATALNIIFFILKSNQSRNQKSVASPGFFRGELPGHLKAITPPPLGGSGDGRPPMITKFKILKWFKVLENESIFQKYQHFSCPKNQFFLRKIANLQKFMTFSKNYF